MRTEEPIAIVGMACRFPGAPDAEAFWEVLSGATDVIREVPEDRFDIDEYYDPDPDAPGKMYTRYGGFLDEHRRIRSGVLRHLPARGACWMDPQQRLLLEVALGGAGACGALARGAARQPNRRVRGRWRQRVLARCCAAELVESIDAHFATGNAD